MKITKKMNVPAEFLYTTIINSVLYDIKESTGRVLLESQLEGFDYVKNFYKNGNAHIKIKKVKKNELYEFHTVTKKNEFKAIYAIQPIDSTSCDVSYHEEMASTGLLQSMNDFFTGILLGYFKKKQFKKMLKMMEESY